MRNLLLITVCLLSFVIIGSCRRQSVGSERFVAGLSVADSLLKAGSYDEAMRRAIDVRDDARNASEHFTVGLAEDLIADIMEKTVGGMDVVHHRIEAAKEYIEADSIEAHRYAMIDVAVAYANADSMLRACMLLDSLRTVDMSDSVYMANCIRTSAILAVVANDDAGMFFLRRYLEEYRKFYEADVFDYVFNIIELPSHLDAQPYIDSARSLVRTELEKQMVDFATVKRLYRSHRFAERKHFMDSTGIFEELEPQALQGETKVMGVQRDYYNEQAQLEKERGDKLTLELTFMLIMVVMITAGAVVYHNLKMKLKDNEIESKMDYIEQLSSELSTVSEEKRQVRESVENLYRERWETVNLLSNEFFEKSDSEKARASIVNEIERELDRMRTPRKLKQIEDLTNRYLDGIVEKLRAQCDFIKEDDVVFLTLIYAGFSPRAVCIFVGIKLKYYYTKRSRLIARIDASDAPDKNMFIEKLQ